MSLQTEIDGDGFTAAEKAYFSSQGQVTDGLVDDPAITPEPDVVTTTPEPAAAAAAPVVEAPKLDPDADPFDELEKSAKQTRDKTGKVIPEANFRVVSEKYKSTKAELADFKKKFEEFETARKADQDALAKEREMRTRIDERLKLFNEVIAPQAGADAKPAAMPNPEEDLFGAFKWAVGKIEHLEGQIGQTAQTVEDTNVETQLRSTYQADAQRFAQQTPDFGAAYNHVNRIRDAMLASIGYADPEQRAKIRMDEERALVAQALQSKKSPAAVMYEVAKSLGYVKAAPAAAPAATTTPAAAAPAVTTPAAPSVTEEIERLAKAQAASKSLSSGGGAPAGAMTVETLANMSEAEFEAYARKNPAVVKQLMGG